MLFYSTNRTSPEVDFHTALFVGLAPDGGLYIPQSFPKFTKKELASLNELSLTAVGSLVLQKWLPEIPENDVQQIVKKALDFPIPLVQVGDTFVLELFHGPTKAFKDVAAAVLAQVFAYYLAKEDRTLTILVATSGDTGGAIAQAFSGIKRVRVVVLYPDGRVSKLQEEQLTRVNDNIIPIAVKGYFDDCQAFVKQAFVDPDLQHLHLSSANSISIGRLLPQIIYYVWCYAQLQRDNIQFVVPSGNMGNVTAGLFAAKMGLPVDSFVIAANENDSVVKYFKTGTFAKQETIPTLSNAMDIGNPSNFVRILEIFKHNHKAFCALVSAITISDKETVATVKEIYKKYDYLADFHTAVGFAAYKKSERANTTPVILSTASPIKFASEIEKETEIEIDDSKEITALKKHEKRMTKVENKYKSMKEVLLNL